MSPTRAWILARGAPALAEMVLTIRREVVAGRVGSGVGVGVGVTWARPGRETVGRRY
jgi:hypothetical protein